MTFAFDFFGMTFPKIGASFSFDFAGGGDRADEEADDVCTDSGEGERRGALRKASSEKPSSGTAHSVSTSELPVERDSLRDCFFVTLVRAEATPFENNPSLSGGGSCSSHQQCPPVTQASTLTVSLFSATFAARSRALSDSLTASIPFFPLFLPRVSSTSLSSSVWFFDTRRAFLTFDAAAAPVSAGVVVRSLTINAFARRRLFLAANPAVRS